jgi:hypothetical protein
LFQLFLHIYNEIPSIASLISFALPGCHKDGLLQPDRRKARGTRPGFRPRNVDKYIGYGRERILNRGGGAKSLHPSLDILSNGWVTERNTTVRGRVKPGRQPRTARRPVNKALKGYQEEAFIQWIVSMRDHNMPVTPRLLEEYANKALRRA